MRMALLNRKSMTTEEIQQYIDAAVRLKFDGFISESGEIMTSEGGEGRFAGLVIATKYTGLLENEIFLAIGETALKAQIVKLGRSESLRPDESDLDTILLKELGIVKSD